MLELVHREGVFEDWQWLQNQFHLVNKKLSVTESIIYDFSERISIIMDNQELNVEQCRRMAWFDLFSNRDLDQEIQEEKKNNHQ